MVGSTKMPSNGLPPVVRLKSGAASRGKPVAKSPLHNEAFLMQRDRIADHQKFVYGFQRKFAAWLISLYAFFLMAFGTFFVVALVIPRPPSFIVSIFWATIIMLLFIPAGLVAKMVWEKVYGD